MSVMQLYVNKSSALAPGRTPAMPPLHSNSTLDQKPTSTPALRPHPKETSLRTDSTDSEESNSSSSPTRTSSSSSSGLVTAAHLSKKNQRLLFLHRKRQISPASSISLEDAGAAIEEPICPVCWRPGCRLTSHRQFASRRGELWLSRPRDGGKETPAMLPLTIGNSVVDPFINLPIPNADTDMQRAFRDFFTSQSTSMTNSVRVRSFDVEYGPVLVKQALSDPALCHTCIAMSATYSAIHGQSLRSPDAKLLSIYGRTFRILREELAQGGHKRPRDTTIMAAVNLLMCHGVGFGDDQAMAAHPAGLMNLVNACGGIQNLSGQLAALSLWSDYYVTLHTGNRPMFLDQVGIMPEVKLMNPPPVEYGREFPALMDRGLISSLLLEVCDTTCRLTELLEDRVRYKGTAARWEFFMYRRNSITMRSGLVHSELYRTGTKAECVSLVNNLLLLLVLRLMPWNMPIISLSDQLRVALKVSGLDTFWDNDINLLIWILFVLQAVEHWDGKAWALQLLLDTLTRRYGCKKVSWPPNWREMQRLNLMDFAWSEIYLSPSFKNTCRDLGTLYREHPTKIV